MSLCSGSRIAARRVMMVRHPAQQQKRSIVDYLTNYPDKVNQIKKIQCKGGTTQGPSNPTWLKQPQDKVVAGFVFAFAGAGLLQVGSGYYKLATGKGKLPL